NSLPNDMAVYIASTLEVADVCSLGSCSRYWREICCSDSVWWALYRDRWPEFSAGVGFSSQGWRGMYISKHNEMASKAESLKQFLERAASYESLEVGNYSKAIQLLNSMRFEFKDVQIFFLKPSLCVLLNVVALHYCILCLNLPAEDLIEALSRCSVSERQVCVQWWKLGRWFYGFRLRDEMHSRNVSLRDLAATGGEEVLRVLHRGAIHEVIRVQILTPKQPTHASWSHQQA
ncbi:hypothetical protein M569_14505, partial [Genlisea aurea]